jgi:hypothetical protein
MLTIQLKNEIIVKMENKTTENHLLGISDYFWFRNKSPVWMKFKLHQREWQIGWDYAKKQDIRK